MKSSSLSLSAIYLLPSLSDIYIFFSFCSLCSAGGDSGGGPSPSHYTCMYVNLFRIDPSCAGIYTDIYAHKAQSPPTRVYICIYVYTIYIHTIYGSERERGCGRALLARHVRIFRVQVHHSYVSGGNVGVTCLPPSLAPSRVYTLSACSSASTYFASFLRASASLSLSLSLSYPPTSSRPLTLHAHRTIPSHARAIPLFGNSLSGLYARARLFDCRTCALTCVCVEGLAKKALYMYIYGHTARGCV